MLLFNNNLFNNMHNWFFIYKFSGKTCSKWFIFYVIENELILYINWLITVKIKTYMTFKKYKILYLCIPLCEHCRIIKCVRECKSDVYTVREYRENAQWKWKFHKIIKKNSVE